MDTTGRFRFRSHRTILGRERLVLQVERRVYHDRSAGPYVDSEQVLEWVDAQTKDLTAELLQALKEA